MASMPYTDTFLFIAYVPLDQIGVIDYLQSGSKE